MCDDLWDGKFYTVGVDSFRYDPKAITAYDPQKPEAPWVVREGRYLRVGFNANYAKRFIGRFDTDKEAAAFEQKIMRESRFGQFLNPRYPMHVVGVGALLVSESFTCKPNLSNAAMAEATWIKEVDGRLIVGGETECKGGKKKKTVSVVDCAGVKTLLTDTISVPCSARVTSCLGPLPEAAILFEHMYSDDGSTNVAVRAYDIGKRKQVFKRDEANEGGPDAILLNMKDVDGDGAPEVVYQVAGTDEVVEQWKWRNHRFQKVPR
jgi:hypothetical protein